MIGPTPGSIEKGTPMPSSGSMMSAYITAPSTLSSLTGSTVTWAHSSGVRVSVRMSCCSRRARYPASALPACRMNHTGVRSAGCWWVAASSRCAPVIGAGGVDCSLSATRLANQDGLNLALCLRHREHHHLVTRTQLRLGFGHDHVVAPHQRHDHRLAWQAEIDDLLSARGRLVGEGHLQEVSGEAFEAHEVDQRTDGHGRLDQ